mgnify:CR=1 FL=1
MGAYDDGDGNTEVIMNTAPQWSWWVLVPLVAVLGVAGGARVWYLLECAAHAESDAAFEVQGRFPLAAHPEGTAFRERARPTQLDELVANVSEQREFRCRAPLSDDPDGELTAHLAPGYPLLHGTLEAYFPERSDWILRWLQCILGTLTAGCYFLLARRAFHSTLAGFVAGLLAALPDF